MTTDRQEQLQVSVNEPNDSQYGLRVQSDTKLVTIMGRQVAVTLTRERTLDDTCVLDIAVVSVDNVQLMRGVTYGI